MTADAEPRPLSGAEFKREVGADPEKWAQQFVRAYAGEMREAEIAERVSWVAPWFRDAMEAAVKAAHGETWPPA